MTVSSPVARTRMGPFWTTTVPDSWAYSPFFRMYRSRGCRTLRLCLHPPNRLASTGDSVSISSAKTVGAMARALAARMAIIRPAISFVFFSIFLTALMKRDVI